MNDLYTLMEHLKQCPAEFLKESVYTNPKNGLDTNALVLDLYRKFSRAFDSVSEIMNSDHENGYTSEHLIAIHLAVWFFSSGELNVEKQMLPSIQSFMFEQLIDLSNVTKASKWIEDEERVEEFVRSALMACEILPENESFEEAFDRLESISVLKRNKVLARSKKAFDRVLEVRRKMAEQKAREAANVYGRE